MSLTKDRVIERRTLTGHIDRDKYGDGFVVVTAELAALGDQRPYFSVTAETWTAERYWKAQKSAYCHSAGSQHELVLDKFPWLKPVVDLHLADEDGVPMHALANGWYWYSDYDGKGTHLYSHQEPLYSMTPHERGAHYLRVSPDELPRDLDKEAFSAYVETLRPRWQTEAERAREVIRQGAQA